jgi:hypothetical protein
VSILGLANQQNIDLGDGAIEAPSATFGDVFDTTVRSTARNYMALSQPVFTNLEFAERDKKYKELTGRDIYEDAFTGAPNRAELEQARISRRNKDVVNAAVDSYLMRAKAEDPEKFKDLLTSEGIAQTVKEKAKASAEAQAKASAGASGFSSVTGQLAGGFVAGFADPVNLATIPLGAGMASGILRTAIIEAGINVAGEALVHPAIKKWQNELGQEYGFKEFTENAGFAALFGGIMGGGARALSAGLEKLELANYAKLAKMREELEVKRRDAVSYEALQETLKTKEPVDEIISALSHEERRLHIEEADPARYNPEISPANHQKALEEVDAALNEGRPIDGSKINLSDEQMKSVVPKEMKAKVETENTVAAIQATVAQKINSLTDGGNQPGPYRTEKDLPEVRFFAKNGQEFAVRGFVSQDVGVDPYTKEAIPEAFADSKGEIKKTSTAIYVYPVGGDPIKDKIGQLLISNTRTGAMGRPDLFGATSVGVNNTKLRRQGLATAMYDYAEAGHENDPRRNWAHSRLVGFLAK